MIFILQESLNSIPLTAGNLHDLQNIILKVFLSHRDKKHVGISEITNEELINQLESIDPNIRKYLKLINKNVLDHTTLKNIFFHIAIVNSAKDYEFVGNTLNLNYKTLNTSFDELTNRSILVCEDRDDAEIYIGLAKDKFKDYARTCNHNLEILHGGGNRTAAVVGDKLQDNDRFCLIICDSDKNCPTCKLGDTAKAVKAILPSTTSKNVKFDFIILDFVREIENLYTPEFLGIGAEYLLDDGKHQFYDFKNGLEGVKVCKHKYWDDFKIHIKKIHQTLDDKKKITNIIETDDINNVLKKVYSFGISNSKNL